MSFISWREPRAEDTGTRAWFKRLRFGRWGSLARLNDWGAGERFAAAGVPAAAGRGSLGGCCWDSMGGDGAAGA